MHTVRLLILSLVTITASITCADRPRNVLFISIDDLRNDVGYLGVHHARTPTLDSLALNGRAFKRHYVQMPTCGASRYSLLSGRHPKLDAHLSNAAIRDTHSDWSAESLPAWFRRHGYQTLAMGKITHYPGGMTGRLWAEPPEEMPGVWDRTWIPDTPWGEAETIMHGYANGIPRTRGETPPWEAFDGPDKAYADAWIADEAIATLHTLAQSDQPWFFAVGFFKPHLPFAAPKKYFDLHDPHKFAPPPNSARPTWEPSNWHPSGEFRNNYGHSDYNPDTNAAYARLLRHAYAASTTYVDAQVGRVIKTLNELGLDDNTIIVVWGDHGFLLGEHAIWGKHCLYEEALRAPLIISHPDLRRRGAMSGAVVETIDIFPTLLDLCGIAPPTGLDGRSLVPYLNDPFSPTAKPAFGFRRNVQTVRTDQWRLIVHRYDDGGVRGVELFDYLRDPYETRNVAEQHPKVVENLLAEFYRLEVIP